MKFSGNVGNGPMNERLNFGGDPDHRLDTGIVFRIRNYWEIWKVVNGCKRAAHTDSLDGGTGKTCLGGGMHCPSASSLNEVVIFNRELPLNVYTTIRM